MGKFELSAGVDTNMVFLARRSELAERFDPEMAFYNRNIKQYAYPTKALRSLLQTSPQYGANECGIIRNNNLAPRYVRITDIDEYGNLIDALGVTAEIIEKKYIINNDDLLIARSGNTVGKVYLHKSNAVAYDCFFAGYMIRFVVDSTKILPEYFFIYTQLTPYKNWVKAIQRAAGQPNINAEEYKSLPIPLPSLSVQNNWVCKYQQAEQNKKQKEKQAQELLNGIDVYLLAELGITLPEQDSRLEKRMFTVPLNEVTGGRLDPDYALKFKLLFSQQGIYKFVPLKELLISTPQYGANEEAKEANSMNDVRYIRITDIDNLGNLKNIGWKTAGNTEEQYILNKNDILFARSGSVGRCYIHKKTDQPAIFAGYLIRFIVDNVRINPEYLFYYCNSNFYKFWVSAIQRPAVQANINAEEYRALPIPLPPIEKQNEIAAHISHIRAQAKQLQQEAAQILATAKNEIERMILGESA
ncbi:MAG: hypothetical protein FD173_1117 [Gallionellaceae bacterium]|nr:MAG: hypothetical protein FD173_1117 [Gallionellaceae bacterium]